MSDNGYKPYRKTQTIMARPYVPGESMRGVAINQVNELGPGGMTAV